MLKLTKENIDTIISEMTDGELFVLFNDSIDNGWTNTPISRMSYFYKFDNGFYTHNYSFGTEIEQAIECYFDWDYAKFGKELAKGNVHSEHNYICFTDGNGKIDMRTFDHPYEFLKSDCYGCLYDDWLNWIMTAYNDDCYGDAKHTLNMIIKNALSKLV